MKPAASMRSSRPPTATFVRSRSAASAVWVIPSRRDKNASTHHCERVMPRGFSALSTTTRRNRDTSWIRNPKRRPVLRSLIKFLSSNSATPHSLALRLRRQPPFKHVPRDDGLHHFDRTACDLDDARISIGPANRVFPHVTPATEQLQALVDRFAMQFRRDHLRHRGVHRVELPLTEEIDALVGEDARHGRPRLQVREHELRVLKIRDRLAES